MTAKTPTKADLERRKLEAEVRKTQAEAVYWESKAEQLGRFFAEVDSSDESNYVYQFNKPVGASSVTQCLDTLSRWSRSDPKASMTIVFDSPGGSVIDGLNLYDFITNLKRRGHHITTITRGYAASMAGVLLQAGDLRLCGANSWMLVHEVGSAAWGKTSELEDELKFTKRLQEQLLSILAERSTLTKEQIRRKWRKTDFWVDADEMVKYGWADYIEGTEPKPKRSRRKAADADVVFTGE